MDRGVSWATVHVLAKESGMINHTHVHMHTYIRIKFWGHQQFSQLKFMWPKTATELGLIPCPSVRGCLGMLFSSAPGLGLSLGV